jgi:integrase
MPLPLQITLGESLVAQNLAMSEALRRQGDALAKMAELVKAPAQASSPLPPSGRQQRRERLRGLSLREYFETVYRSSRPLRPATLPRMRQTIGLVERWRPALKIADIGRDLLLDFRDWMAGYGRSPETRDNHQRNLRALARAAWREGLIEQCYPALPFAAKRKRRPATWSPEELIRLEERAKRLPGPLVAGKSGFDTIPAATWWLAMVALFSELGCRPTALMLAERTDFDGRRLTLQAENQKQDDSQRFSLSRATAAAVDALLSVHPHSRILAWPYDGQDRDGVWKWRTMTERFKSLLVEPAGLAVEKGAVLRKFRRTNLTLLCKARGKQAAQQQAGHASEKTTELYLGETAVATIRGGRAIDRLKRRARARLRSAGQAMLF